MNTPNEINESPEHIQPTEMAELIFKIQQKATDVSAMATHITNKTKEKYLDELIQTAVMDLTLIPVVRALRGTVTIDDAHTVTLGFKKIVNILANMFYETPPSVEAKILETMESFPAADVQEAFIRREQNNLH